MPLLDAQLGLLSLIRVVPTARGADHPATATVADGDREAVRVGRLPAMEGIGSHGLRNWPVRRVLSAARRLCVPPRWRCSLAGVTARWRQFGDSAGVKSLVVFTGSWSFRGLHADRLFQRGLGGAGGLARTTPSVGAGSTLPSRVTRGGMSWLSGPGHGAGGSGAGGGCGAAGCAITVTVLVESSAGGITVSAPSRR